MKRIVYIILLFIFIFQYNPVIADDTCTPDNNPTVYNTKDIHLKVGSAPPDYYLGVYAIDSCNDITSIHVNYDDVLYDEVGEYPLFYYARGTSVQVTVFIESDLNTPIFKDLKNHEIEINTTIDYANGVSATDYKDNDITENIKIDSSNLDISKLGIYLITYIVEDDEGNRFEQDVNVIVKDTIIPTIENYQDLIVEVHTNKEEYNWWENLVVKDNSNLEVTKSIDLTNLNTDELGEYTITYFVYDSTGNNNSVSVKVKVVDTKPPEINVTNENISFNLSEQITDYDYQSIIEVTDNYDGEINSQNVFIDKHNVNYNEPGTYKVFVYVSDSNGNFSTKIINVTIIDNIKPEINGTKDLDIIIGTTVQDICIEDVSAYDLTDGNLTNYIYIDYSLINPNKVGEYPLTYIVFDSSGNERIKIVKVSVIDIEVPKIEGINDLTIEVLTENFNFLDGITAIDNNDGNLTSQIQVDLSQLNLTKLGTYTVTYTVKDSQENETTKNCLVTVVDTTAPEIIGYKDITIQINEEVDLLKDISAYDNYDGELTEKIIVIRNYDIGEAGTYTITLEVVDTSNNKKTITYFLIVENDDIIVPVDPSPVKTNDYTLYYIISILGVFLIASGIVSYMTRKKQIK